MFYLNGADDLLQTIFLLSSSVDDNSIQNIDQLKHDYLLFLNKFFSDGSLPKPSENCEQFCFDEIRIKKLISHYEHISNITDFETKINDKTPLSAMQEALANIKEGKLFLNKVNSSLAQMFDVAIHTLFYSRSAKSGGGSVSSAPGVIWCSIRRDWTNMDIGEFLVHELTHNLVFLDELCYQHYTNMSALGNPENFAQSSILNKKRPLDKAFHSLVVANEILCYREEAGEPEKPHVHPDSARILASCKETINSIHYVINDSPLVTSRFREILNKINISLQEREAKLNSSKLVTV